MIKLLSVVLGLLAVFPVYAAKLPGASAEDGAAVNALKNPGFENGKVGWTASGGSFTISNSTDLKFGKFTGVFDPSAASQCLTSDPISMTSGEWVGFKGMNGYASFLTSTAATDFVVSVWNGTNDISTRTLAASVGQTEQGVSFVYPDTGTVSFRVCSQSNAPKVTLENARFGLNNVAQVGSAEIVATLDLGTGTYETTSTVMTPMVYLGGSAPVATGKCTFGTASTTELVCPNLAPGKYTVSLVGGTIRNGGGPAYGAAIKLTDGTNDSAYVNLITQSDVGYKGTPSGIEWAFTLSSATSKTFQADMQAVSGGTATYSADGAQIIVKRYPLGSEQAVRMDTVAWNWTGLLDNVFWDTTSTSYVVPNYAGGTPAVITQKAKGASCVQNANNPSVICTIPALGDVRVCAHTPIKISTAGQIAQMRLVVDGVAGGTAINTATDGSSKDVCGTFSPAALTFQVGIEIKASAGTASMNAENVAGIQFEVAPASQQIPAPILVGGVVSSAQGVTRQGSATITNDGVTASIYSQDGSMVSSVVRNGAGDIGVVLAAGFFGAVPRCFCNNKSSARFCKMNCTTSSICNVSDYDHTGASTDSDADIFCTGPK